MYGVYIVNLFSDVKCRPSGSTKLQSFSASKVQG